MAARDGGNWNLGILNVDAGANRIGVAKLEGSYLSILSYVIIQIHFISDSDSLGDLGLLFSFLKMERHLHMRGMEVCVGTPSTHALNVRWGSLTHADFFCHLTKFHPVRLMGGLYNVLSFHWCFDSWG